MSTIGNRIHTLRKQQNITQEELAAKMGYKSKSSINKIELGINDIPQSKIVQFAHALSTTPAFLMGWEEKDAPETSRDERLNILYELTKELSEDELIALKGFVAGLKANRKPD